MQTFIFDAKASESFFVVFFSISMYLVGEALKYDKNFKGPLAKRSCTDVCCLLIFVVFLGCWGFIAHYGKWKLCFFINRLQIVVNRKVVETVRLTIVR